MAESLRVKYNTQGTLEEERTPNHQRTMRVGYTEQQGCPKNAFFKVYLLKKSVNHRALIFWNAHQLRPPSART